MKKKLILSAVVCLIMYSCNTVKIADNTYPFESFKKDSLPQSVQIGKYGNPNERPGQEEDKVVIVCASGGGSRAASFSIGIMLELEKILVSSETNPNQNVLSEVDYFSTVSGGGWGVSTYIAHKYQYEKYSSEYFKNAIKQYNDKRGNKSPIEIPASFNASEKYLLNVCNMNYFKKQVRLIPSMGFASGLSDRRMIKGLNEGYLGWANRRNIEKEIWKLQNPNLKFDEKRVASIYLGDVFKAQNTSANAPIQIPNTTNIDNYSLVPFTPDRLKNWGVIDYNDFLHKVKTLPTSGELSDYDSIPFATGIKASSGIPFAVNASSLKTKNKSGRKNYFLHIQDGGIVDQQAIHSAKAVLSKHNDIKNPKNRIVIVIDASSSGLDIQKSAARRKAGRTHNLYRVMAPFTSPDSQYSLTRERIKLLEKEYNCTVIYLGVDLLLDASLNNIDKPTDLTKKYTRKNVTEYFCNKYYTKVQKGNNEFLNFGMADRKLLYSFINKYMKTAFNSKGDKFDGKNLKDEPRSTATMMVLCGRGVVQLKKEQIKKLFQ